jgi:hypothetical protein
VKNVFFAVPIVIGFTGLWLVARSYSVASGLGDLEDGNFFAYAWVGYDPAFQQMTCADYPTGEAPWYSAVSTWWLGFDCLALAVALACGVKAWTGLKRGRMFFSVAGAATTLTVGFVCVVTGMLLACVRCN